MGFLERRKLEQRVSTYIARGLDALDAGAEIPASSENDPLHEWLAPGRYRDLDLTVDLERIQRIAAARGLDETAVLNAAVRLGRKKGD
jgi:hypothetical protein